ncbi:hypothetical protein JCM24511_04645 [Saitozyma sp. JCM 24511]|nr:hypothetical protein JCM24511_04645 [Saitozyma sp. JCM 24511]
MPFETPVLAHFERAWNRSTHRSRYTWIADGAQLSTAEPTYLYILIHVIELPAEETRRTCPPDQIPHWLPSVGASSADRQDALRRRLKSNLHELLDIRPVEDPLEAQSSAREFQLALPLFTQVLDDRVADTGLDVEETLLKLINRTKFTWKEGTDHYSQLSNGGSDLNPRQPNCDITLGNPDSTGWEQCSMALSIDLNPDGDESLIVENGEAFTATTPRWIKICQEEWAKTPKSAAFDLKLQPTETTSKQTSANAFVFVNNDHHRLRVLQHVCSTDSRAARGATSQAGIQNAAFQQGCSEDEDSVRAVIRDVFADAQLALSRAPGFYSLKEGTTSTVTREQHNGSAVALWRNNQDGDSLPSTSIILVLPGTPQPYEGDDDMDVDGESDEDIPSSVASSSDGIE